MVNFEELTKKISQSGLKLNAVAKEMGVSRQTLYYLLKGKGDFTAKEITVLSNMLNLTVDERESIFFAQ